MSRLVRPFCLIAFGACLAAPALAYPVYQWKDANGVTHVSDTPPTGQKFRERELNNHDPGPASAAGTEPAVENPQCTLAKKNLATLSGKGRVLQDTDGDGKPDTALDDSQREAQKNLAEAAAKAYCKPDAP